MLGMIRTAARDTRLLALIGLALLFGCGGPRPGHVLDEASLAGRDAASFPAADEDYFHDMDGGVALTTDEVKGRNMWLVWTGGNDRFWDVIPSSTFGALDLLKTISSKPGLPARRDNRWTYLGVVNEPCFEQATGPDPDRFGLWLDKRRADCPPDPFENETKYPGVKLGARGKNLPVGSYYGYATGIVGCDYFPIRISMKQLPKSGIRSDFTTIRPIIRTRISFDPTAWACHARSAMSDLFRPSLPPLPRIPSGKI